MLEYAIALGNLDFAGIFDKLIANPQTWLAVAAALVVVIFFTTRRRR